MFVDFNILNQLGSPAINSNTFANRPAAGQTGRLFVSTDTFELYRDNGTTYDLIGGPGSSTITGSGTATQVAFFSSTSALTSSANLFFDNTNNRLGVNTATPTVALDVVGKSLFTRTETYSSGNAIGAQVIENLTISSGTSVGLAAIGGVNSQLNLTLGGNATIANTGRQGLEGNTTIAFNGAGTLTMTQGSTIRAFSALSSVYAFAGSAIGTITHLAGYRICFPDNSGSAVNVTNNYALLINDQTTGTGTVTYTNRWGVYQEGTSDLNYMAANLLLGSTTNSGEKLQVTGTSKFTGNLAVDTNVLFVDTANDRVGIGISTPNAGLEIANAEQSTFRITRNNNTGNYLELTGGASGANYDIATSGTLAHIFKLSGAEAMRIIGSNLLVGTTTDSGRKLDVAGAIKGNSFLTTNGNIDIASGATATIYTITGSSSASGLYFVSVGVLAGSNIYTASGVVTATAHDNRLDFTSFYDGANVTLQVSGMNIQIVNNGFATFNWRWSIQFLTLI